MSGIVERTDPARFKECLKAAQVAADDRGTPALVEREE